MTAFTRRKHRRRNRSYNVAALSHHVNMWERAYEQADSERSWWKAVSLSLALVIVALLLTCAGLSL